MSDPVFPPPGSRPLAPASRGTAPAEPRLDPARGRVDRRSAVREVADSKGGEGPFTDALSTASNLFVGLVAGSRDGGSGEDATGRHPGSEDAAAVPALEDEPLDLRLGHVGDTIAMVCRFEQTQCVWSARIPLDRELLPDTVLHLTYSPALLTLHFETSDWETRSLLQGQMGALRERFRACLQKGVDLVISL